MRALLTGFGPFPGAPFNPSAALVAALARRRRPALADIEITTHVFPTTYAGVDRDLPRLLAEKPDIVLMFGLAGRTRELRIETRARNAVSVLFPDAGRHRPSRGIIESGGPRARSGRAPFHRLLNVARSGGAPARISRDAGRYLCNYAYWRALQYALGGRPLVQFIHIPLLRRTQQPRARTKHRAASISRLLDAAECLLIALAAASKR